MTDHKQMSRDMLNLDDGLTPWEIEFLESIDRQLEAGRTLTAKQAATLEKIWSTH
jgi:hypothetical protein